MTRSASDPKSNRCDPAELVQQYQAGVWRYLRGMGCDATLAEDLTQETFLKVLQKPFDHYDPAATASYLRRVAHNLFITVQRRAGKVVLMEDLQQYEATWYKWMGQSQGDDVLDKLQKCFELLSPRAKWALEMRYRDSLSRSRIAEKLKITEHGTKNLIQRAKRQLRDCVQRQINSDG